METLNNKINHNGFIYIGDVKEFIRKLKEYFKRDGTVWHIKKIDELAGDKLI